MRKVGQLMSCISRANRIVRGFENEQIQKADKNEDKFVFYSYWMNHLALASVILAKKYGGISVSRCHGYDLYKRAENHQYVTLQRLLTKALDHVYPISDDGKNTLCSLFPDDVSSQHKVEVSRLGTHDFGIGPVEKDKGYFVIVSCSNVVPLKRVGLILDAVLSISDMPIRWIHFGDGPLLQEIKEKKEASPYGMHDIRFLGYTPKQKIMEYYENNHVDLFINVSESEGIPVSIMEALSFGIPCIATNVGGVKEIIHSENGWLIAPDIQSQELADYIRSVKNLETESYTSYRENARLSWEKNYSAKKNYTDFVMQLEGLQ